MSDVLTERGRLDTDRHAQGEHHEKAKAEMGGRGTPGAPRAA